MARGQAHIFSIQVGDSKINVHPEGYTAALRGPTAVPGSADICFVWNGAAADCERMLQDAGVAIIAGPGPRRGATARQDSRQPLRPRPRRKPARMDDLRVTHPVIPAQAGI
ncbi:Glyoxalase domain-containing protein RDO1 [Geodia barretti]|uniref:Glyoxalase domain-containing protein RDO1 n=1 Tax=Geodia barretti TaxID=519541 RepID=A0AA35W4J1_GEOBA|nr:Glyoxalase domain-containing protein RDO1 [Geodia barretti]